MTASESDTSISEGVLERFNGVQVYVHALLAVTIFVLWQLAHR
mgnify:CR=1 FL=1